MSQVYRFLKRVRALSVALCLALAITLPAAAQDMGVITRPAFFTTPDANGVNQIYQVLVGDDQSPRQITNASADVATFGTAYDGLSVAYVSDGQLWLQPIHTDEPEALAPISSTQSFGGLVFSPDNRYLAYADGGVWLFDLGTRQTKQVLKDVELTGDNNMSEFRIYRPERFVLGMDGQAVKLIVDVGVWEWNTAGVYDLVSGEYIQLEGQDYTNLLPLHGGFVLVYGNSGVAGEPSLSIAPNLDSINQATKVVDFAALTDEMMFAERAVEIAPGVVRIYGQGISLVPGEFRWFYLDYSLVSGADKVKFYTTAEPSQETAMYGELSPDGALLPMYLNLGHRDTYGTIFSHLRLVDITTGQAIGQPLPDIVGEFRWQP